MEKNPLLMNMSDEVIWELKKKLRSVLMRTSTEAFKGENGGTTTTALQRQTLQNCNCCPYGYHIDLDFIRYCESLVKLKQSDGQMLRRDKRRSMKSMEFMLGLESLFEHWEPKETVQSVPEIDSECNTPVEKSVRSFFDESAMPIARSTPDSSTTSAFMHDCLDDVVNDFERTLERAKNNKRDNKRNGHSWEDYIEIIDSCVAGNGRQRSDGKTSPVPPIPPPRRHGPSTSGESSSSDTLVTIRKQMAISLQRMKDLEEQVKNIPKLQTQIIALHDEKRQLQKLLQQKEDEMRRSREKSSSSVRNSSCSPVQFTPQRISPVSLESLSSKLRTSSLSPESAMKRDVAVGSVRISNRSVGTNTINTRTIDEAIYTKGELDEIIELAMEEYELQRVEALQKSLISVGTQMIPEKLRAFNVGSQTSEERISVSSVGVSVSPKTTDSSTLTDPTVCEKCSIEKEEKVDKVSLKDLDLKSKKTLTKNTGTQYQSTSCNIGTQYYQSVSSVGIQNVPQMSSQSTQFTKDGSNKQTDTKDLVRTVHSFTNTNLERQTNAVNSSTNTEVVHIRDSSVNTMSPPSVKHEGSNTDFVRFKEQISLRNTSSNTDLVKTKESGMNTLAPAKVRNAFSNTDLLQSPVTPKISISNSSCNTDKIRTHEFGVNTHPPSLQNNSSNTDVITRKDIGCGDIVKPHISIACADNYCDSCKDAIKNLAKDFAKVSTSNSSSSLASSSPKESKIPRALPSPKQPRKTFMRQNTYTVTSSSSSSPSPVRRLVSENTSISLDSAPISRKRTSPDLKKQPSKKPIENDNDRMSKSFTDELERQVTLNKENKVETPIAAREKIVQRTSWVKELSPQRIKMPPEEMSSTGESSPEFQEPEHLLSLKDESPTTPDLHEPIPTELLDQIATSMIEPRDKKEPSQEMKAALKVINDSLLKFNNKTGNLKNANSVVQKEWFTVSSTDTADALQVEDYLDYIDNISTALFKHVVNMTDTNGNTAMHYAVSHGNFDVVSILLDSKVCNVNQTNNAGYTSVMLVTLAKLKNSLHRSVVQRLFKMADVNVRAKKHAQTALMLAVSHGNLDMVDMLLEAGADINIQDEDGSTALMCAAEHGRIDIVKHLLSQSDCDSLIQDVDNSTAFKIAWHAGHRDIGLLLYVHEQMLRSKLPSAAASSKSSVSPKNHKRQPSS
ncbi:KANK1 family protein [Megaselia abdita]